jgi:hypothetical protein
VQLIVPADGKQWNPLHSKNGGRRYRHRHLPPSSEGGLDFFHRSEVPPTKLDDDNNDAGHILRHSNGRTRLVPVDVTAPQHFPGARSANLNAPLMTLCSTRSPPPRPPPFQNPPSHRLSTRPPSLGTAAGPSSVPRLPGIRTYMNTDDAARSSSKHRLSPHVSARDARVKLTRRAWRSRSRSVTPLPPGSPTPSCLTLSLDPSTPAPTSAPVRKLLVLDLNGAPHSQGNLPPGARALHEVYPRPFLAPFRAFLFHSSSAWPDTMV